MNSPLVTIVLCTRDRPEMLRDCLRSLREQTARESIGRVLVSENGLTGDSERVCADFPDLPILYVQQRPPVFVLLHTKAIWRYVETPLAAVLHDDDWWMPTHLRSALDALASHRDCVAVYSSFLETFGPRGTAWLNQCYYLAWFATGGETARPVVTLDATGVMLASLLNAGLHYSTVVGRSPIMWDAFSRNIARGNTFDNDRTFPVFLAQHGPVAYVTSPNVFVRSHPGRDAWSVEHLQRGHMKMAQETTRFLRANYPEQVLAAAARFREIAATLEPTSAEQAYVFFRDCIQEPQLSTLANECGIKISALKQFRTRNGFPHWATDPFNDFCPPALNRWLRTKVWDRVVLWGKKHRQDTAQGISKDRRAQDGTPKAVAASGEQAMTVTE